MGRRSGGYKGRRSNEPRMHSPRENEKTVMLNLSRLSAFKYDLREIMSHYEINEPDGDGQRLMATYRTNDAARYEVD